MNILLLGLVPSAETESGLLSSGHSVESQKKASRGKPKLAWDLIAVKAENEAHLKELAALRKANPLSWLCLAVPLSKLNDPAFLNVLLHCTEKDEVWVEEAWERSLSFSLQGVLRLQEMRNEVTALQLDQKSLRQQCEELSRHSKGLVTQFEKDLGLASNIQRSLLPRISPEIPGVSLAVKYLPAAGKGGDYYDIFEFGDKKRFGVLIADSKTHGLAAALLSALLKVRLEEMKDRFPNSQSFVEYLNRELQQIHEREMASLSLLYGILDRASLTFQYTSAGNLKPLLWRSGECVPLSVAGNPPLGGANHFAFRENILSLQPGDLILLHTDGLEAPMGNAPSAYDGIIELLKKSNPSPDPLEVQNELMGIVDRYLENAELKDDVTLIHFAVSENALYLARKAESE